MSSTRPITTSRHLSRWLAVLAASTLPLLAQANNCVSPNSDDDYILGDINGTASTMHWATGLVWKRCIESEAFNNGACSTDSRDIKQWDEWANEYLPQPFDNQSDWGIDAAYSHNLLVSGGWRMPYLKELNHITENCGNNPKINRTVFPNTSLDSYYFSTGSLDPSSTGYAWFRSLNNADQSKGDHAFASVIHLVRGGQAFANLPASATKENIASNEPIEFDFFTLAATDINGQAWGGARIEGTGNPEFKIDGESWVKEAIVKSGDQITVRLTAPGTATFTLRSGQTTGTNADGSNGGNEVTEMKETTATFTATAAESIDGVCGTANGVNTAVEPANADLCSAGEVSNISGNPLKWTWNCTGTNGGTPASCQANRLYTVTSSVIGGNGSIPAGSTQVVYGTTLSFQVVPDEGYEASVGGTCDGMFGNNLYVIHEVTKDCTVEASFTPKQYIITASVTPANAGSVTCNPNPVNHGSPVVCTLSPEANYVASSVTGTCGGTLDGDHYTTQGVTEDCTVVAGFAQLADDLSLPEGESAGQPLGLALLPGQDWVLDEASTATVQSLNAPAPEGVLLPHGLVSLKLSQGVQGSKATVVLTYPEAFPEGTVYYKYGKTLDKPTDHWYEFSGAVISGNTITLTIKDGGEGDNDLSDNSEIDDPGGPAVPAAPVPAEVTPVPTLGQWALLLLASLLGVLGLQRMRTVKAR